MDLRPPENYIVHVYMWPWLGLNSCDYPGPCFHIMRTKPVISLLIKGVMWGGGGWDGDITILEIICRCVDIFSAIRFGGGGGYTLHLYWKNFYLRKKFTRSQNMTLFVDVFVIYWSDRWRVLKSINKEIQLSCSHAKTFQRK